MSFAPYRDTSPSSARGPTNPPLSPARSDSEDDPFAFADDDDDDATLPAAAPTSKSTSLPTNSNTWRSTSEPNPNHDIEAARPSAPPTGFGNTATAAGRDVDEDLFATTLDVRLGYLAALAYVGVPPVAGAVLLVCERRSDYVRFHAWQSSLLFTFLFLLHLILSFSRVLSYMLLVVDLGLIGFLARRAFRDAETLERWQVPFFGRLANSFVFEE